MSKSTNVPESDYWKAVTLRTFTAKDVALEDALRNFAVAAADTKLGQSWIGLFYTPTWCGFGRLDERGTVQTTRSPELRLAEVFEARVFNSAAELRWLHDRGGKGKAVVLAERAPAADGPVQADGLTPHGFAGQPDESLLIELEDGQPRGNTYLLWGEGVDECNGLPAGWSQLATARIGALDIPLSDVKPNQRVQLVTREYVKVFSDCHGNAAVVEERLIGLQFAEGGK